jgi:CubicO group peptidase (beta-lactamase class C family)
VFRKAYGFADLENGAPATMDTVFCIGSISKQFGAAAILQLVEAGKLRLDDKLARFYPDFPHADAITIHDLLHQTTGITDFEYNGPWPKTMAVARTKEEVIGMFRDLPFQFDPGTRWAYSTSNYYLLGMIVEKVGGQPLEEYLKKNVFDRAGLRHTSFCDPQTLIPHHALGYDVDPKKGFIPTRPTLLTQFGIGGGLCSTAGDLLAWQHALEEGRVVGADSYRLMSTPAPLADGTPTGYGYGLFPSDFDGHPMIGHSGGVAGFSADLNHYVRDHLRVIVLTNTEEGPIFEVERLIAATVLGLPPLAAAPITAQELAGYAVTILEEPGKFEFAVDGDHLTVRYVGDKKPARKARPLIHTGGDSFETASRGFKATFERKDGRVVRVRIDRVGMTSYATPIAN